VSAPRPEPTCAPRLAGPEWRAGVASLALLALLAGCRGHAAFDYSKEPDPRQREYVIGISDQLSIQVWRNPEVSGEVTVRPDGAITLPLIGDLVAGGRTPSELRDDITKQLTKFLRGEGPVVTVAVTAVNSYSFTVSGNVERPGVYTSARYVTVLEAIQLAGGPNRFASPGSTQLARRTTRSQKPRNIPINYPKVLDGSQPEANLVILPGDQIYVP
jgi:polysaccharide export outer membrane protein